MPKLPISLVAIVRNAGGRVKTLIEKHRDLVNEVVIVDQYSTDGTYEEAVEYADTVYRRRCKGTADPDRNWAFARANSEYVLYLDDDECLTDETKKMLPQLIETGADAFWFKRQNFVDGADIAPILGDDIQCRLFRKGAVRFSDEIHTYPETAINTKVFFVECAIRHDRTLDGLIKANKARESKTTREMCRKQDQFIEDVKKLLAQRDGYTDNWYSETQLKSLSHAFEKTKGLEGEIIEIGCWEGKSTCYLAKEAYPEVVQAVDTWKGNLDEGSNHASVVKAKERDVHKEFLANVQLRTRGNVVANKIDCHEFMRKFNGKVKFCHLDASHDYESVKKSIELLKPHLVKGAVLCGDDFLSANANRADLNGGVERAVRELCPGFSHVENFWYWINK